MGSKIFETCLLLINTKDCSLQYSFQFLSLKQFFSSSEFQKDIQKIFMCQFSAVSKFSSGKYFFALFVDQAFSELEDGCYERKPKSLFTRFRHSFSITFRPDPKKLQMFRHAHVAAHVAFPKPTEFEKCKGGYSKIRTSAFTDRLNYNLVFQRGIFRSPISASFSRVCA